MRVLSTSSSKAVSHESDITDGIHSDTSVATGVERLPSAVPVSYVVNAAPTKLTKAPTFALNASCLCHASAQVEVVELYTTFQGTTSCSSAQSDYDYIAKHSSLKHIRLLPLHGPEYHPRGRGRHSVTYAGRILQGLLSGHVLTARVSPVTGSHSLFVSVLT